MPSVTLDRIACAILRELQADARISYSELGRRVNLTPPAAAERVRRLEEAGVIRGYRAHVDPEPLGLCIEAIVRVGLVGSTTPERFLAATSALPELISCYRVTGADSFVLHIVAASVDHLEAFLSQVSAYGQAVASIVLSKPIECRPVPTDLSVRPASMRARSGCDVTGNGHGS